MNRSRAGLVLAGIVVIAVLVGGCPQPPREVDTETIPQPPGEVDTETIPPPPMPVRGGPAIAGLVLAALLFLVLLVGGSVAFVVWRRRRARKPRDD